MAIFDTFLVPEQAIRRPFGAKRCSASKRSKTGSQRPENVSLSTPNGLGSLLDFGYLQAHSGPILGPFCGRFGAVLGPNATVDGVKTGRTQVQHKYKAPHTLSEWIPSQDTATGLHRCPSWSPRALFGAIWGSLGAVLGPAWQTNAPCGQKTRTMGHNRNPKMVAWGPRTHPGAAELLRKFFNFGLFWG